jgi:hypothetical protein
MADLAARDQEARSSAPLDRRTLQSATGDRGSVPCYIDRPGEPECHERSLCGSLVTLMYTSVVDG